MQLKKKIGSMNEGKAAPKAQQGFSSTISQTRKGTEGEREEGSEVMVHRIKWGRAG